jgi:hypothetical protein
VKGTIKRADVLRPLDCPFFGKSIPNFFTAMLILLDWSKYSILCANDLP